MTEQKSENTKEKNIALPIIIFIAALALVVICLIALPKGSDDDSSKTENNRAPESVNNVD